MLQTEGRSELTMREREEFEQQKELSQMQIDYNLKQKEMDVEVAKIEARWNVLLRVPVTLVKLPVLIIMAIAYCIAIGTKQELPEQFWKFLK